MCPQVCRFDLSNALYIHLLLLHLPVKPCYSRVHPAELNRARTAHVCMVHKTACSRET